MWDHITLGLESVDLVKLLLAVVLGGLVGWEREWKHKPAGLRTIILICVGSTFFTTLSVNTAHMTLGQFNSDPGRIAAQIVSGIGFLGAGTIMQARGSVHGLTTAATLWVVAAIGMAIGLGYFGMAVGGTSITLLCLVGVRVLEGRIGHGARTVILDIHTEPNNEAIDRVLDFLRKRLQGEGDLQVDKGQDEHRVTVVHVRRSLLAGDFTVRLTDLPGVEHVIESYE